jgi:hypothetical protein
VTPEPTLDGLFAVRPRATNRYSRICDLSHSLKVDRSLNLISRTEKYLLNEQNQKQHLDHRYDEKEGELKNRIRTK